MIAFGIVAKSFGDRIVTGPRIHTVLRLMVSVKSTHGGNINKGILMKILNERGCIDKLHCKTETKTVKF
jgi:hypothetical protein